MLKVDYETAVEGFGVLVNHHPYSKNSCFTNHDLLLSNIGIFRRMPSINYIYLHAISFYVRNVAQFFMFCACMLPKICI